MAHGSINCQQASLSLHCHNAFFQQRHWSTIISLLPGFYTYAQDFCLTLYHSPKATIKRQYKSVSVLDQALGCSPVLTRPSGHVNLGLQPRVWSNPDPKRRLYSLSTQHFLVEFRMAVRMISSLLKLVRSFVLYSTSLPHHEKLISFSKLLITYRESNLEFY